MKIRLLLDSSAAGLLARLHAAAFRDAWSREWIEKLMAQPGVFACLAGESGFVLVRVAGDEAEVLTLAVEPAARRRGLASALLATASQVAQNRGVRSLFLEVGCRNLAAITLYKRLGFIEVGRRLGYYAAPGGEPEDGLIMRVEIPLLRVGKSLQLG